jgi:serine/threonine protein kinase
VTHPPTEFLDLQAALAGEYSLQRELGRGGMGVVYLARDVQLDRDVAIKVLPTHLAHAREARERFLREARMAAGLSHPHIVPIHRVGEAGGFVFFVMSYVEGETLGERLRTHGPLPPTEVTRVLREVSWALAYAHGRGIVHRDVKPDNILLEAGTGRALVTDFGIAHADAHAGIDENPGRIMGTAHFMSPEQVVGDAIDGRSDIYALGVVGYLAVSGRLPFESQDLPALMLRQATETPPSVLRAAPGLPRTHRSDRPLSRPRSGRAIRERREDGRSARPDDRRAARVAADAARLVECAESAARALHGLVRIVRHHDHGESRRLGDRQSAGRAGGHPPPRRDRGGAAASDRRLPPESGTAAVPRRSHARRSAFGTRDRRARACRDRRAGAG